MTYIARPFEAAKYRYLLDERSDKGLYEVLVICFWRLFCLVSQRLVWVTIRSPFVSLSGRQDHVYSTPSQESQLL